MNLKSILTQIGKSALKTIPAVSVLFEVISFINNILPDKHTIDKDSTGIEILKKLKDNLSDNDYNTVLQQEFEIESIKNHTEIVEALSEVDKMGKSTRPYIAKLFAINTVIITDMIIVGFLYAIFTDKDKLVAVLTASWPLIVGTLTPFIVLLRSYFGLRTKEKAQKYEAISNVPAPLNAIAKIIEAFKKK